MPTHRSARSSKRASRRRPGRLEVPLLYLACTLTLYWLAQNDHDSEALAGVALVVPAMLWRVHEAVKPRQRVRTWNEPRPIPRVGRRTIYGPDWRRARQAPPSRIDPGATQIVE